MQCAEFEEKEYEMPLYHELLGGSVELWTPGQVFEQHFGIDAALQVNNPLFWQIVGCPAPTSGAILNNYRWTRIWRDLARNSRRHLRDKKRLLPNFSVNLLLQVKRPDYLKGSNANLSRHGIHSNYWRFKTTHHQQDALEYISHRLSRHALVTYGCAAFHTHNALFLYSQSRALISHSSFVRVTRLSGHRSWAYDAPGTAGVACSEMKRVTDPWIFDHLTNLREDVEPMPAKKALIELFDLLLEAMEEVRKEKNPLASEFFRRMDSGVNELKTQRLKPEVKAFSVAAGLLIFLGTSWLVSG